jgi:proteasome lid subunit RPN8/RPN11
MLNIPFELRRTLLDYAQSKSPEESCGYLVRKDDDKLYFFPSPNIYHDPSWKDAKNERFAISAEAMASAENHGEVVALFHSHTFASIYNGKLDFSEADKVACEALGMPWVLAVLPQEDVKVLMPSGYRPPLMGRQFVYGAIDCYALVRDAFYEIGITLNDYPRGALGEWNDNPNWNFFEENFAKEGFLEVDRKDARKYDVLLMQVRSQKINHVGLMWEPSANVFIHHLIDRLSERSLWDGYWRSQTVKIVRHQSLF